jgi:hypothetical protein
MGTSMSSAGHGSAVRRALASASLGASAVGVAALARDGGFWDGWVLAVGGLIGLAAIGLGRRSVLSQVLSRGVAWVVLTPMLVGLGESLGHGRLPDAHTVFFATTSAGALLLARPALHTDSARTEFAPLAYRRLFLAGAVASAMTAVVVALFAVEQLAWHHRGAGLALAAFSAALLASAVGVVRMRAWGVLLGMVTAVGAAGAALLSGDWYLALGLALAAVPGALLGSALAAARLRRDATYPSLGGSTRVRLAPEVPVEEAEDAAPSVFARVGVVAEAEGEELAQPVRIAVSEE